MAVVWLKFSRNLNYDFILVFHSIFLLVFASRPFEALEAANFSKNASGQKGKMQGPPNVMVCFFLLFIER
jgi:hypothetical protein